MGDGQPLCMAVPDTEPGITQLCLRRGISCHSEERVGTGSCFVATSWLHEHGVLAALGTFFCQPVLALHPTGEQRL